MVTGRAHYPFELPRLHVRRKRNRANFNHQILQAVR